MKTTSWIRVSGILAALMIFVYGSAIAASILTSPFPTAERGESKPVISDLNREESPLSGIIRSMVGYPSFLKKGNGTAGAILHFHIDPTGKIDAVSASSQDPQLIDYLEEKLLGVSLPDQHWTWGKTYHFALQFRLIGV